MSILRKAAQALAKAQSGGDDFDGLDEDLQETLIGEVRAVLLAIRKPTEEMLSAGAVGSGEDSKGVAYGAWEAMIDAALAEES